MHHGYCVSKDIRSLIICNSECSYFKIVVGLIPDLENSLAILESQNTFGSCTFKMAFELTNVDIQCERLLYFYCNFSSYEFYLIFFVILSLFWYEFKKSHISGQYGISYPTFHYFQYQVNNCIVQKDPRKGLFTYLVNVRYSENLSK